MGQPANAAERGRQFCRVLPRLAGPWRHAGLAARLSVDLLHLLFGSILAVDSDAAFFVTGVASLTLLCIALFYRGLVSEAFDSARLQVNARRLPALLHGLFLALLVLNLVAGFQVLGTLMAVGLMMLPAVARCWARTLPGILLLAAAIGAFLRPDGIEPFVGSEFTRRARHRADRQRTVFYFSVFWHAQPVGRWLAQINGVRK